MPDHYMSGADARELCELRIKEDGVTAGEALREFRSLSGWGMRDAVPVYRRFQALEKQMKELPHA